jgi:hypothetical protein
VWLNAERFSQEIQLQQETKQGSDKQFENTRVTMDSWKNHGGRNKQ